VDPPTVPLAHSHSIDQFPGKVLEGRFTHVSTLRALRRRILTPNVRETQLEKRGFHVKNAAAKNQLETVGATFLQGYAYAVEARSAAEAEEWLETIPTAYRGFAYEGAGMGAVVLDSLTGSGKRLAGLLAGEGARHDYMIYVGIGWAMARLPRPLWPDLTATDPLLRWLILDGYGFHQAYFHTDRYVRDPAAVHPFHWKGGSDTYSARVIDQGIGRALWFVGGTCPDTVAALIGAYPAARRPDLWAGSGLACTYAGSADEGELRRFAAHAGEYLPQLAQGSAFASEARVRAGTTTDHTRTAARVLNQGRRPEEAAAICRDLRPATCPGGDTPAFETWRRAIATAVTTPLYAQNGAGA
jgi:enediyne biosynthesis protein E3